MKALTLIVFVVACGGGNGGDANTDGNTSNADAKEFHDAPPNVPAMIALSGETSERGLSGTSMVATVTLGAYKIGDETTPVAMATSDAQGKYTLDVPTNGLPFDGFVKASKSGYVDIYLYPASAWIADFTDGGINMLTPSNKDLLNNFASGGQTAGKGMVGLAVLDASGNPVAGATIAATPAGGTVRYTGSNGLPSSSATMTSADGVAFVFNAPENVTIAAVKSGLSFHAHAVKARADKFTTTSVAP
ncbi:MAG: hypothetical protein ABI175_11350 [Polyangiales bacterium]